MLEWCKALVVVPMREQESALVAGPAPSLADGQLLAAGEVTTECPRFA